GSKKGEARYLAGQDWTARATRTWTSPVSGAEYPSRWTVELPGEGLRLEVTPTLADQENRSALVRDLVYWEGAVTVQDPEGRTVGQGYVELTGYGTTYRPGSDRPRARMSNRD
ncbi:MAG: lipocalin family protein, partial [Nitrospinota bacterium]